MDGLAQKYNLFAGDMCGRENTAQTASVEFVLFWRTHDAGIGLHSTRKVAGAPFRQYHCQFTEKQVKGVSPYAHAWCYPDPSPAGTAA